MIYGIAQNLKTFWCYSCLFIKGEYHNQKIISYLQKPYLSYRPYFIAEMILKLKDSPLAMWKLNAKKQRVAQSSAVTSKYNLAVIQPSPGKHSTSTGRNCAVGALNSPVFSQGRDLLLLCPSEVHCLVSFAVGLLHPLPPPTPFWAACAPESVCPSDSSSSKIIVTYQQVFMKQVFRLIL